MRVGIIALLQESNTFLAEKTSLRRFEEDILVTGAAVRDRFANAPHEVGGFLAGLDKAGIEAVPIFAARALPFGTVTVEAFDELTRRMFAALDEAGPLDGVLVAPHGATVAEDNPDADGAWLTQLRQRVGPEVPIIGTLDPHANLSPAMVQACDALTAYRTNPHLDQRERGLEAAKLMVRTLHGEIRPTMAAGFPPLVINIERQSTSANPCGDLLAWLAEFGDRALSTSLLLGFPYADVAEVGASVLVVTDGQPEVARFLANEASREMIRIRHEFVGQLIDVVDAVERALALKPPVCLLDMGDNVGGGAPGDGTWIAQELHRRQVGPAFVCLHDPDGVRQADETGIGGRLEVSLGGRGQDSGDPLQAAVTVTGLFDGRFRESAPTHGGFTEFDQGRTAIVQTDHNLTVMLTSRRMVPFSIAQLTSCSIDPSAMRFIVAKGVHAPVGAYEPVCGSLLRVNTPGVTTADLSRLQYQHRRRPLFPFEELPE